MNRYIVEVTDSRGYVKHTTAEYVSFADVLSLLPDLCQEYPDLDVHVVNRDNIDYDCADGLNRAERELVEEVVS